MEGQNDKGSCLVPGCDNPAKTRGLCATHYMYAHRLVSRGKTTWSVLEQEGKCLGSHASPNDTRDWFMGKTVVSDIQEHQITHDEDGNLLERDRDLEDHNDPDNQFEIELGEGD